MLCCVRVIGWAKDVRGGASGRDPKQFGQNIVIAHAGALVADCRKGHAVHEE